MNESTKVLYREIEERYVKVVWTHTIQLCQAEIYTKEIKCQNWVLALLSVLVSASAITHLLQWLPVKITIPILASLSLLLTFCTILYKAENYGKAAIENESFAALMHNLRNKYAGLLSEIKAGSITDKQIIQRRELLEQEENLIYSGIVPSTSQEAVDMAQKKLKTNQNATTTDEEIKLIISPNLQIV